MDKKFAFVVSGVALAAMVGMFVGVGIMLGNTTRDLGVALVESAPTTVIAKNGVTTEEEAALAAEKAYAVATDAFRAGVDEISGELNDVDGLIAYEATRSAQASADYAQPLGESRTVWAGRSQTLASVVAMEVIGIGVLALVIGFITSRIVKRSVE